MGLVLHLLSIASLSPPVRQLAPTARFSTPANRAAAFTNYSWMIGKAFSA